MKRRTALPLAVAALTLFAACGGDDDDEGSSATTAPTAEIAPVTAGEAFPADRCAANQAAGKITYLSGFDFAAAASILEVVVADAKGYYEQMCLDVELVAGTSTENLALVAANDAQFSSSGSFSEMTEFSLGNEADLVAVTVAGRTTIDTLIVLDDSVNEVADLAGKKIGVKFALPRSIKAMLAGAGLEEGTDFETVLLDGFDPKVHAEVPGIAGFPGWKSNEPDQLRAAGYEFDLFDPADHDIPGSFGIIYSNQSFLDSHPTAAADFVRATLKGLADAVADPAAAAQIAVDKINSSGNPFYLSPEGETARWAVEAELIGGAADTDAPLGVPLADLLTAEVTTYAAIGLFGGTAPEITPYLADLAAGVYDNGVLIWPATPG